MADKIVLDAGGKERVAMEMAYNIMRNIQQKSWEEITADLGVYLPVLPSSVG